MIGRLDSVEKNLIINGSGTSAIWNPLLKNIKIDSLVIIESESGVGPSDHTSFYLKDIPVLHFFSGLHMDYHKPTDDENKINYDGMELILTYMTALIDSIDNKGKVSFSKTQDTQSKSTPKFSVTLGVMPDYSYSGKGLKITGVTESKPAQKAGLLANDIVVKIGDYEIVDIYSYMDALSKFKKGEKTSISVSRNNDIYQFKVEW
jgi:C-terminal processing protease CtpA/Prc